MKVNKRSESDYVGKKEYDFEFEKEIIIYRGVCGEKLKWRERRKLEEDKSSFYTYRQWKRYILEKYRRYDRSELEEFERYLKNRKTICMGDVQFIGLGISVLFSFLFTGYAQSIIVAGKLSEEIYQFLSVVIFILVLMKISVEYIRKAFVDYQVSFSFYEDYLEIIDFIIKEKE